MKIETKFDVDDEIYGVTYAWQISDNKGWEIIKGSAKITTGLITKIEILIEVEKEMGVVYFFNFLGLDEEDCFPHTPEGKEQALARIGELND